MCMNVLRMYMFTGSIIRIEQAFKPLNVKNSSRIKLKDLSQLLNTYKVKKQ